MERWASDRRVITDHTVGPVDRSWVGLNEDSPGRALTSEGSHQLGHLTLDIHNELISYIEIDEGWFGEVEAAILQPPQDIAICISRPAHSSFFVAPPYIQGYYFA